MILKPSTDRILQLKNNVIRNPNPSGYRSICTRRRRSSSSGRFVVQSHEPNRYLQISDQNQSLNLGFNPEIPIEEALTPPSSWYTDSSFLSLELHRVFFRGWQAVGHVDQIQEPTSFFTGRFAIVNHERIRVVSGEVAAHSRPHIWEVCDKSPESSRAQAYILFPQWIGNVEYVVCRDDNGGLHAFHNVCRHHASLVASASGKASCFVCPYHGWTYGLDGALLKATRLKGIKNFNIKEFGLIPLRVAIWGPFILVNLESGVSFEQQQYDCEDDIIGKEWLGTASEILTTNGVDNSIEYLCRREYTIDCNWKVFIDNYLDGGYHVPFAHKGLASGLKLDSYSTALFEKVSIQSCDSRQAEVEEDFDRLGSKPLYAFIYPNFMVNRYGPWMDTNLVLPLGPRKCKVIFDYFLDASLKDDEAFVERSLNDSERVQMEDMELCESVQKGLESPAYSSGRYAPAVEKAMHHFHCLLDQDLTNTRRI